MYQYSYSKSINSPVDGNICVHGSALHVLKHRDALPDVRYVVQFPSSGGNGGVLTTANISSERKQKG
jgi:hypothetical protein